jgi:hypothetical protein
VAMRNTAKLAWREIRSKLLKQLTRLERTSNDEWLVTVISWVRDVLPDSRDDVVTQIVTEQTVDFEDLPDDVRSAYLRSNVTVREVDVTRMRDQQFIELGLTD